MQLLLAGEGGVCAETSLSSVGSSSLLMLKEGRGVPVGEWTSTFALGQFEQEKELERCGRERGQEGAAPMH